MTFRFRYDLCPQEYTIMAASHDPDGVLHDWMEDALAFFGIGRKVHGGGGGLPG